MNLAGNVVWVRLLCFWDINGAWDDVDDEIDDGRMEDGLSDVGNWPGRCVSKNFRLALLHIIPVRGSLDDEIDAMLALDDELSDNLPTCVAVTSVDSIESTSWSAWGWIVSLEEPKRADDAAAIALVDEDDDVSLFNGYDPSTRVNCNVYRLEGFDGLTLSLSGVSCRGDMNGLGGAGGRLKESLFVPASSSDWSSSSRVR